MLRGITCFKIYDSWNNSYFIFFCISIKKKKRCLIFANIFINRQFHKLFIVRFANSFTDRDVLTINYVRIVKVVLPGDHSSWSSSVPGQIVYEVSSVVVFVLLNEFDSASCVSVAALSANGACLPPPVVVALMLAVRSRVV